MAEKKKILYIVEAMGGGVFTYIVDPKDTISGSSSRRMPVSVSLSIHLKKSGNG